MTLKMTRHTVSVQLQQLLYMICLAVRFIRLNFPTEERIILTKSTDYIDLTSDQFTLYNLPVDYEHNEEVPRQYCGKNADTAKRLKLLISQIGQNLHK